MFQEADERFDHGGLTAASAWLDGAIRSVAETEATTREGAALRHEAAVTTLVSLLSRVDVEVPSEVEQLLETVRAARANRARLAERGDRNLSNEFDKLGSFNFRPNCPTSTSSSIRGASIVAARSRKTAESTEPRGSILTNVVWRTSSGARRPPASDGLPPSARPWSPHAAPRSSGRARSAGPPSRRGRATSGSVPGDARTRPGRATRARRGSVPCARARSGWTPPHARNSHARARAVRTPGDAGWSSRGRSLPTSPRLRSERSGVTFRDCRGRV